MTGCLMLFSLFIYFRSSFSVSNRFNSVLFCSVPFQHKMAEQLAWSPTSHRQFFRERATDWHYHTSQSGLLHAGPCERGSRYRNFALTPMDVLEYLHVRQSPLDKTKLILSVGGHVRTVVDGPMKVAFGWWKEEDIEKIDIDEIGMRYVRAHTHLDSFIYALCLQENSRIHAHICTHTQPDAAGYEIDELIVLLRRLYSILTKLYAFDSGIIRSNLLQLSNSISTSIRWCWRHFLSEYSFAKRRKK